MSLDAYQPQTSEPGLFKSVVKFVGGTAAVTKVYGVGLVTTYISAGIVDLTWSEDQGTCVGISGSCFQATTPANVKSYVLVPGVYNATTRTLRLNMYESGTLTDLAALEWLSVTVDFKRTGV